MSNYRSQATLIRRVRFTGLSIHSVSGSRTAVPVPAIGSILIRDPFGHDEGDRSAAGIVGNPSPAGTGTAEADPLVREGLDYTRPQAGYLHMQKVVVVGVTPGGEAGSNARMVDVVNAEEAVAVLLNGTVAETDYIVPVAGQYHGVAQTIRTDTIANAVADINTVLRTAIGIALQDNSGGPNLRAVKLGGPFNPSPDRV